jgi:DNA-dependent RNA polymerase auxiliary subunit epsilon
MIYKVLYQESKDQAPRRETTETLYMEADSSIEARATIQANTNYNIELIQELTGNHLEYEQKSANYHLTEFTNEKTERQE